MGGRKVSVCRLCMVVAIFVPSFLFFHLIPGAKTASRAVFRPGASTSTTNGKGEIRQGPIDSPRICDRRQTSSRSLTTFAKSASGFRMTPAKIFLWGGGCHGSKRRAITRADQDGHDISCPHVGQFHTCHGAAEKLSQVLCLRGAGHRSADSAPA